MKFYNKIAIVTGGVSGIGRSVVESLLEKEARVFVLDNQVEKASDLLSQYPEQLIIEQVDVRSSKQIEAALQQCRVKWGVPSLVVASAGVHHSAALDSMDEKAWDQLFDTNVKGVYYLLKTLFDDLKKEADASVVVIGSDQSIIGKSNNFAYGASKGAVAQMVKSLAIDFAPYGIRINCVSPGPTDTPLLHHAISKHATSNEHFETLLVKEREHVPMQRLARADEIASATLFLLSEEASFITGILLPVDGGLSAGIYFR